METEEVETKPRFDYPLSGPEVVALISDMHLIAARYTKCAANRHDYVQCACLKLLAKTTKNSPVPPLRVVQRAIEDYRSKEKNSRLPTLSDMRSERPPEVLYQPQGDPLTYAELREFAGLGLNYTQAQIAKQYWHQNRTMAEIAAEEGLSAEAVSTVIKLVRQAVQERWLN